VRVTTALNRMLRLPGASVIDVSFGGEGVIVTVRLRRRRRVCARCGQTGRRLRLHGHRVKRWRHFDLGASRCFIECELRRLWCPDCGAQFEAVPWARPGSRYTRDFEDVLAWLARQMAAQGKRRAGSRGPMRDRRRGHLRGTGPQAECPLCARSGEQRVVGSPRTSRLSAAAAVVRRLSMRRPTKLETIYSFSRTSRVRLLLSYRYLELAAVGSND